MRPLLSKVVMPVGAMDDRAVFCKVQIPRHAGQVVVLVADARQGPLHVAARRHLVDAKGAAGCWGKLQAGRYSLLHKQVIAVVRVEHLLGYIYNDALLAEVSASLERM